jgi:hypothetical protein
VCDRRPIPSGCTVDAIPSKGKKNTDCSVVVDEGGEYENENIANLTVDGALDITAGESISLGLTSVDISEYLSLDATGGSVEISKITGNTTIGGPIQIDAGSVEIEKITGSVSANGGLCVKSDGEVELTVTGNATIDGDLEVRAGSGEDATVNLKRNATVTGDLTIQTEGDADIEAAGCSRVQGTVSPTNACSDG